MSLFSGTLFKPRQSGPLPILFRVLIVVLLVGFIWWISFRISNAVVIHRLEVRIREIHEPLTPAELATMAAAIPDAENGALSLLKIWEEEYPGFGKVFSPDTKMPPAYFARTNDPVLPFLGAQTETLPRTGPLSAASRRVAELFLQERRGHLDAVHAALQLSRFQFPVQLTNGYNATLPHLGELKYEANHFRIRALLATEAKDIDGALAALDDVARAGHTLNTEPILISQLVRLAIYASVLDDLERLLSQQTLSDTQLERAEKLVDQLQTPGAMHLAFVGERVFGLDLFNHPAETLAHLDAKRRAEIDGQSLKPYEREAWFLSVAGLMDFDRLLTLQTWDSALRFADEGSPAALNRLERSFRGVILKAQQFPRKVVSGALLPNLEGAAARFAALEGRRRAALVAVAIERFRLKQGRLPETLEELAPQFPGGLPRDPFVENSLQFARLPTGYVVYSVGRDRSDDNGKPRGGKPLHSGFDETFIVETPQP
jgi:hypothetical protein